MMIKIGSFLTSLHESTPKYDTLPLFVKKIFRAAGNMALWNQDDSAAYRIVNDERTLSSNQASGISLKTGLHPLVRHLTNAIPEDSTVSLLQRFEVEPDGGQTNRSALIYALARQFFRCVDAANNEAENVIPSFYQRAVEHPSIMFDPSDSGSLALFVNEVGGFCPLCSPPKKLTYRRDGTPSNFTTIQIFPDDLSPEEKPDFVAAIGDEPESHDAFENRIAVCRDCADRHHTLFGYDVEEAKRLKAVKESFAKKRKAQQEAYSSELGTQINEVLDAVRTKRVFDLPEDEEVDLTYDPVMVCRKIPTDEDLCDKVTRMAVKHYDKIRLHFFYLDKAQEGTFDETCDQVKKAYRIFARQIGHQNQEEIFNQMVRWLNEKTFNSDKYITACEIVISFFVQNCEVFVA